MAFNQFPSKGGVPSGNTAGRPSNPVIGDTYYNGQVEALEIYNGTTWKVAKTEGFPPDAPTISSVTDSSTSFAYSSTAGTLDVVFVPSGTGGTATQYNAYTTTGGHSGFTTVGNTVTITGLTPNTAYTVYGNAQNGSGTSTNTANASPATPTTLPEVRTIGTATASTSAIEVTVTWTNGSNGGKNLSAITITPFLNGTTAGTSRTAATTSSTSYTFTQGQLTTGASYTFKVKATNANGTCADSTATNSATVPNSIFTEYVVIGGGGGTGARRHGAGGGAGGYRSSVVGETSGRGAAVESKAALTIGTTYTITVGNGGASNTGSDNSNTGVTNGGDSSISGSGFTTITSLGGG
jgi:mannan endo-1,4-beta-mannosidase